VSLAAGSGCAGSGQRELSIDRIDEKKFAGLVCVAASAESILIDRRNITSLRNAYIDSDIR
jgi:hypothetical protein